MCSNSKCVLLQQIRQTIAKKKFAIPFLFSIFAIGLAMNQAVHID